MSCKGCVYYDEWEEGSPELVVTKYCNLHNEKYPKKCGNYTTIPPVVQEVDDDPEWRY